MQRDHPARLSSRFTLRPERNGLRLRAGSGWSGVRDANVRRRSDLLQPELRHLRAQRWTLSADRVLANEVTAQRKRAGASVPRLAVSPGPLQPNLLGSGSSDGMLVGPMVDSAYFGFDSLFSRCGRALGWHIALVGFLGSAACSSSDDAGTTKPFSDSELTAQHCQVGGAVTAYVAGSSSSPGANRVQDRQRDVRTGVPR
jgi:hypothetical protein